MSAIPAYLTTSGDCHLHSAVILCGLMPRDAQSGTPPVRSGWPPKSQPLHASCALATAASAKCIMVDTAAFFPASAPSAVGRSGRSMKSTSSSFAAPVPHTVGTNGSDVRHTLGQQRHRRALMCVGAAMERNMADSGRRQLGLLKHVESHCDHEACWCNRAVLDHRRLGYRPKCHKFHLKRQTFHQDV